MWLGRGLTGAVHAGRRRTGSIVLFHAYLWNTAQALPAVLARLKAKGIQPASLGETLRASRSAP